MSGFRRCSQLVDATLYLKRWDGVYCDASSARLGTIPTGRSVLIERTNVDPEANSNALAHVVSGGRTDITETLSEDELMDLERESFLQLARNTASVARVQHMLNTGKPLRN